MPLEIIRSYRADHATHHQLMRRLVSYDGWFAPMDVARHATGEDSFEQICMYGDTCRRPPDQLWLFSSADDVMRAHERFAARSGYGLFPYAGPVAGIDLFAALSKRLLAVAIDIVGARDDAWVIDGPGLEVARRWGRALALERSIVECHDDVFVDMLAYDDYLVFEKPDGTAVHTPAVDGSADYVLAFTAIDAAEYAIVQYAGELRSVGTWSGRRLFGSLDGRGVALNLAGPTAPMLPFPPAVCAHLADLAVALDGDAA